MCPAGQLIVFLFFLDSEPQNPNHNHRSPFLSPNVRMWSSQGRFRPYQSTSSLSLPDAGAYFPARPVLEEFKHNIAHKAIWSQVIAGPSLWCPCRNLTPLSFVTIGNNGRAGRLFGACELGSQSGHSFSSCLILARYLYLSVSFLYRSRC